MWLLGFSRFKGEGEAVYRYTGTRSCCVGACAWHSAFGTTHTPWRWCVLCRSAEVHSRRVHHLSHSEASCIFPFFYENSFKKEVCTKNVKRGVYAQQQQQHRSLVAIPCTPNAIQERSEHLSLGKQEEEGCVISSSYQMFFNWK